MRQTKGGLKELINSFGIARDSFRRVDDLLSALNSQFNGLKLLDESPKRKKPLVVGCVPDYRTTGTSWHFRYTICRAKIPRRGSTKETNFRFSPFPLSNIV